MKSKVNLWNYFALVLGVIVVNKPCFSQTLETNGNTIFLSQKYASLRNSRQFKNYDTLISQGEFLAFLKEDSVAYRRFHNGETLRKTSAITGFATGSCVIYYFGKYRFEPRGQMYEGSMTVALMGVVTSAMLQLYGISQNRQGIGIRNGLMHETRSINIKVLTGYPPFGLSDLGFLKRGNKSRVVGIGLEISLYPKLLGFIDAYSQKSEVHKHFILGNKHPWQLNNKGFSVLTGIEYNHIILKNWQVYTKYGFGLKLAKHVVNKQNNVVQISSEKSLATTLGAGFKCFLGDSFNIGGELSLSSDTPCLGLSIARLFRY